MPTPPRWAALLVIGAAVGSLWLVPGGAPSHETGDALPPSVPALPGVIVVDFQDGLDGAAIERIETDAGIDLDYASPVSADEALRSGQVSNVAEALRRLGGRAEIEAAEPAVEITAYGLTYPNDPLYDQQWNLHTIGAPLGWRAGGGAGVTVAVIDTGVRLLPELSQARLLPGRSFVPGVSSSDDDHGHGTHVAGTIAQSTHNGVGVAGVAPRATILPLKVLDANGQGRSDWIAAAIDEAVDEGAQVINLSLGGGHSEVIVRAVEKARAAGVIVVAAAGNSGQEGLGSPADAPSAIAVTATGPTGALAPYSSFGKGVEIAAPGGDKTQANGGILQAIPEGNSQQFAAWQGTSMAAPHVAGAAAVLLGAGAQGADEAERLLQAAATPTPEPLKFGAGALDLAGAVRRLLWVRQGVLFGVGGALALALASLGGQRGWARAVSGLSGASFAGGLFLLPLLPLPPSSVTLLLSRPFYTWLGPFWSGFPLFQSAFLPLLVTLLFAPTYLLGPLALGFTAGSAAFFLYGAATASSGLWWMPFGLGSSWLAVNGALCLVLGLAAAGLQRIRVQAGETTLPPR